MYNRNQKHTSLPWVRVNFPLPPRGIPIASAKAQQRADRIRRLFTEAFDGVAELEDVRFAALQKGFLDGIRNPHAQRNVVRAALSVIAEPRGPHR